MIEKSRIYAIIPARGGSKRILHKNLCPLEGKPLIKHTIDSALNASKIDTIVVSTDDSDLKELSEKLGLIVLNRPSELAQDNSLTIDTIFHFISHSPPKVYDQDILVLLQPTSPLRTEKHIDEAIKLFRSKQCDSVVSVTQPEHPPYWSQTITNGFLTPLFSEYMGTRSQDLPETFIPNGAIFIASVKTLKKYKTYYCPKTIPYIMDSKDSIDIDEPIDLVIAESIIRMRKMNNV